MRGKLGKKRRVLSIIALILAATPVMATKSLVGALGPQAPAQVVAQDQGNNMENQQQITKAILLDDRRSRGTVSGIAPLQVDKTAINGPYAMALVLIGEHGGGVTVLSKKQGTWQVIGGGGGWLILKDLEALGIPRSSAQVLLERLDPNWRNYEPAN